MLIFGKKKNHKETEEEKLARKQAEKEAAIVAYKEKRNLTLKCFFEIAQLPFPDNFKDLANHPVSDFTADPRKLTENSVFMCWETDPLPSAYSENPLDRAVRSDCLCIITNTPCDFTNTLIITDK